MAKIYGLSGRLTGRKGDAVFAVRGGEQIVRQYNPIVANPKTEAQVENRAKLKLCSQLGAIFAPVLAIPSQGAKSGRNVLSSLIYPKMDYSTGEAKVHLDQIPLTNSHRPISGVNQYQKEDSGLFVSTNLSESANYDKISYALVMIDSNHNIRLVATQLVSTPGVDGRFEADFSQYANEVGGAACCVYAYGIKTLDADESVRIDSVVGDSAEKVAKLVVSRSELATSVAVSQTAALEFTAAV